MTISWPGSVTIGHPYRLEVTLGGRENVRHVHKTSSCGFYTGCGFIFMIYCNKLFTNKHISQNDDPLFLDT